MTTDDDLDASAMTNRPTTRTVLVVLAVVVVVFLLVLVLDFTRIGTP